MGGLLIPLHPKAGTKEAQRYRIPHLALAVVVILFLGAVLWRPIHDFAWFMLYGYVRAAPFEASAWKANSLDGDRMGPTKLRMIDDLFKLHLLKGRTGDEVQMLLGLADRTPRQNDRDLLYALWSRPWLLATRCGMAGDTAEFFGQGKRLLGGNNKRLTLVTPRIIAQLTRAVGKWRFWKERFRAAPCRRSKRTVPRPPASGHRP